MLGRKSLKDYERNDGLRLAVVFVVGFVVEVLTCLWTVSHNLPLMTAGTDDLFRAFGMLAAIVGEVVVLSTYYMLFITGGRQWSTVLTVHGTMLAILVVNSVVRYAQLAGARNADLDRIINFYGGYIAPVPVIVGAVVGAVIITHSDPLVVMRRAEADRDAAQRKHEEAMVRYLTDQMGDFMDTPAVRAMLERAAQSAVAAAAARVVGSVSSGSVSGNGAGPAVSLPETRGAGDAPRPLPPSPAGPPVPPGR